MTRLWLVLIRFLDWSLFILKVRFFSVNQIVLTELPYNQLYDSDYKSRTIHYWQGCFFIENIQKFGDCFPHQIPQKP